MKRQCFGFNDMVRIDGGYQYAAVFIFTVAELGTVASAEPSSPELASSTFCSSY